jgi:hypothetical protein
LKLKSHISLAVQKSDDIVVHLRGLEPPRHLSQLYRATSKLVYALITLTRIF